MVTVLWDLYPLPKDFPFRETVKGGPDQKANAVKRALRDDVDRSNFIPNIVVHEFEGLLFSDPVAFNALVTDKGRKAVEKLVAIRKRFTTPEHINEGPGTAPSKQIIKNLVGYDKVRDGIQIALNIGLETIRHECPLFDVWVREIEALSNN